MNMKKLLAVGVIVLFLGLAIAPSINANINKTIVEPIPDLYCVGLLWFKDVELGAMRNDSFLIANIGNPGSLLDWEITEWPDWGTWTFTPASGENLTPEDGQVVVEATVTFPIYPNVSLTGEVKVVNCENYSDYCVIDIVISLPPIEFWYAFIGKIQSPIISNETVTFHADIVFVFWLIFPAKPIINENVNLPNHYKGYIGKRVIFAFFRM